MAECEVNGKAGPIFVLYMNKQEYELVKNMLDFAKLFASPKKQGTIDLLNVVEALENPRKA